jgi:alpha-1,2-mannosyltransferase
MPVSEDEPVPRGALSISQTFGIRLFFKPGGRRRLIVGAAALAAVGFVVQAVFRLATLGSASLEYDYTPYANAASALNHGGDPYSAFLNACGSEWCHVGYIYPPLLAEAFRPLALLPLHTGAFIWLVLCYGMFAGAILVADRITAGWLSTTARAGLLLLALAFVPLYASLYFFQVGPLMLLLMGLAALAFTRRRDTVAGAVLGVSAVLRVTPIIQAPMLIRSRRDLLRPTGAAAMALSAVAVVAFLALMTTTTFEYLDTVLPRLGVSTVILDNQSLPGFLLRLQLLTGMPPAAAIRFGALVLQVLLLGVTWWYSLNLEGERERAAVFAAFLAVTPIVSSITWGHHLVTELLVLVLIAPSLRSGSRAWWLAAISYPLLWASRDATDPLVAALGLAFPTGFRILPFLALTSVNLIGMIVLWLACLKVLGSYRLAAAPAETR